MFKVLFLFFLGTLAGSFANCCIWRLPREKSVVFPPSHCPICEHRLSIFDLIPVFSFLILKGRCRYCGEKINLRYLVVEMILGILFVMNGLFFKNVFEMLLFSAVSLIFVIQAFIDLEHQILPDSLTLILAILGLLYNFVRQPFEIWQFFLTGIGAGFFMFLVGFISQIIYKKEALGGGDIKLAVAFGFLFGWPKIVVALFLGFFIGSLVGLFLIFLKKRSSKDYMPFAPSLITAALLTIFFGEKIIKLYLNFIKFYNL